MKQSKVVKTCAWCGETFTRPASWGAKVRFCSKSCGNRSRWASDTRTLRTCLQCGDSFRSTNKAAKYCSQRCMGAAYRQRVTLSCDHCGKRFEKTPGKVGRFNYCSQSCSRAEHGAKLVRGDRPLRGTEWDRMRLRLIRERGNRCERCGMTGDDHRERFRHALHLHHIVPYRISRSDHPDNLQIVCVICHAKDEPHVAGLVARFAASDVPQTPELPRQYDRCECGGPKAKHAKLCRACRSQRMREASTYYRCPECGGHMPNPRARSCRPCYLKRTYPHRR